MVDLVCIGDSGVDSFIPLLDAQVENWKGENKGLCLLFGAKVPVGESVDLVGGNACNVAVGVARLGQNVDLYTNVGSDEWSVKIVKKLKEEGVGGRFVIKNEGKMTNHSFVLSFGGERTILTHHQDWNYKLPDLGSCRMLYLSSLSSTFVESGIMDEIERFLARSNTRFIFNPGTFQIKVGLKKFSSLLCRVSVLIVNREEASLILDKFGVDIKKLLKGLVDLGAEMVVITDGDKGSFGFDGKSYFKLGVFPAKLKEITGAGDGYCSGLIAGLLHGKELPEAMRWGAANAASVTERIGAQEGLLRNVEIKEILKENVSIKPRQM